MYNTTFHVQGLVLRFDAHGNVNTDYDLKQWVWQNPRPELRTVGTFSGRRLQLQHSRMWWHTGSKVSQAAAKAPGQGELTAQRLEGMSLGREGNAY